MAQVFIIAVLLASMLAPLVIPAWLAIRSKRWGWALGGGCVAAGAMIAFLFWLNAVGQYPNLSWWLLLPFVSGALTIALARIILLATKSMNV